MPDYPRVKDSGVEWIGEIPAHWKVLRGKAFMSALSRPLNEDDEIVTCFRDGEVTLRRNRREDGFTNALKEIGYQGVEPGDLVVHAMDGFAGAIGISDARGKASPVLNVLDCDQNKRYVMYYLRALAYRDVFMALSTGIRVRSCNLQWNKLATLPYVIPPVHEQLAIVAYLDSACANLDDSIAEAKASVEEYKLLKQSVITQTVIKGLDPTVLMKDSGVEWIGKVPMEWQLVPTRRLFRHVKRIAGERANEYERLALTMNGVIRRSKDDCTGRQPKEFESYQVLREHELVFKLIDLENIKTSRVGLSPYVGLVSPAYVVLTNQEPDNRFYYYWFTFMYCNNVFNHLGGDGVRSALNATDVLKLPAPLVSVAERKRIAEYLDLVISRIDDLITAKAALVEDLESYKKSLIYEVVTGKRRVA